MYSILSYYSLFSIDIEHFNEVVKYNSIMNELLPSKANDVYKKPSLVLFYSTTCKHCTSFMPIFNDIVSECNNINFYIANCSTYTAFIDAFNIEHAPTVILFYKGNRILYTGSLQYEPIVSWIHEKLL
jgi:thioredoxin-like negative regulator of GroEL